MSKPITNVKCEKEAVQKVASTSKRISIRELQRSQNLSEIHSDICFSKSYTLFA